MYRNRIAYLAYIFLALLLAHCGKNTDSTLLSSNSVNSTVHAVRCEAQIMDTNYKNASALVPVIVTAKSVLEGQDEISLSAGNDYDVKVSFSAEAVQDASPLLTEIRMVVYSKTSTAPFSAIRLGGEGQTLDATATDKAIGMVNVGSKQMVIYRCKAVQP